MSTSDKKVDIFLKKFLPQQQITENFFDFLQSLIEDVGKRVWVSSGIFTPNVLLTDILSADTVDTFDILTPLEAADGLGHELILDPGEANNIPFENTVATSYFTGLRFNLIKQGTEVNVRTGVIEYTFDEQAIGELAEPDAVVDDGDGTLTITVDNVAEPGVSNAGRKVLVYLKQAVSQASAFEEATIIFSGGANKIETVGALGQVLGSISTTASDYQVFLRGPTVRRNTDLRLDPNVAFTGIVTGAGIGNTPSSFDHADVINLSTSITALIALFFAEHDVTDGTHTAITPETIITKQTTTGLQLTTQVNVSDEDTPDSPITPTLLSSSGGSGIQGVKWQIEESSGNPIAFIDAHGNSYFQNLIAVSDVLTRLKTIYSTATGAPIITDASLNETHDETLFRKLLKATPSNPNNKVINIAAGRITAADGSDFVLPLAQLVTNFLGGNVNLQTGVNSVGDNITPVDFTGFNDQFTKYSFNLLAGNTILVLPSDGVSPGFGVTKALAINPPLAKNAIAAFIVGVQNDSITSTTAIEDIAEANIDRLPAAGGAGAADGAITLEPIPGYQWITEDTFEELLSSSDAKIVTTDFTNAAFNSFKGLFQINVDKTRTVATSSGTGLTINLTPNFTVAKGDIVFVTSGARLGQWRRIDTINSQLDYVLDAAFTGGDASASDTLMISQAVWTKDLVNFGDDVEKTRARDFFSGNILQIAVPYEDSLVDGDDIPDLVDAARVVMGASNEGLLADIGVPTSDTFGNSIFTRVPSPGTIDNFILPTNTNQERLHLVFFANPNNASVVGTCNVLNYEANFYADESLINSGILDDAICFSDGSTTPVRCTVATPAGLTEVTTDWPAIPNVNQGGPTGDVDAFVNGKLVSRFIGASETPPTDLYYTLIQDGNGIFNVFRFNADLSSTPLEIVLIRRIGVFDASDENSAKIATLNQAIVGSALQVTAGIATHTTLTDALAATGTTPKILILNGVTITDNPTISKRAFIEGLGPGSTITGNLIVASGGALGIINNLRIDGNITYQAGATKCFMDHCYMTNGKIFSDDVSNENEIWLFEE